jgi:vitamin B12 transporter
LAQDKVRLSADYYNNQFRDVVSFAFCFPGGPCPVTPPPNCPFGFGTYFNTDLARARGAHLRFEAQITRRVSLSGNYTYNDTRVLAAPNAFDPTQLPGNRLFKRPVNSGNLVLNGSWGQLQANLTGIFVGRRTDSDFLGLGYTSIPGYARLDLAVSYRLSSQVSLTTRIHNLLDHHYQDALGYPTLGVAAYAGVRLRLGGNE